MIKGLFEGPLEGLFGSTPCLVSQRYVPTAGKVRRRASTHHWRAGFCRQVAG